MNHETNSRFDKLLRRKAIAKKERKCSYCKPHSGENMNYKKFGTRKAKSKIHKRETIRKHGI